MTTQLVSILNKTPLEQYDEVCERYNYIDGKDLSDMGLVNFHDLMIKFVGSLGLNLDMNRISFLPQYVKYTITQETSPYTIDKHNDSSIASIIIYLKKDAKIHDEFWVENNKVKESVWDTTKGLFMFKKETNGLYNNSGPEHRGVVRGIGNREILCFFISYK
jgi:hypothetical protein